MTDAIETHRKTALDSPYSGDREKAIEELARVYPNASSDEKRRVLETLRQVAIESAHRQERELARETLVDCFDADAAAAADLVVRCFAELAQESKFSEERGAAIDTLRRLYPDVDEHNQERIGQTLADIAGNGTYEDDRRRARLRLTDIAADERSGAGDSRRVTRDSLGYLGESLAEHLANAAEESPDACRQRAQEVRDFVVDTAVDDESYAEVRDDLDELVEQLEVVPADGDLDDDRVARVKQIAMRVKRLYERSS